MKQGKKLEAEKGRDRAGERVADRRDAIQIPEQLAPFLVRYYQIRVVGSVANETAVLSRLVLFTFGCANSCYQGPESQVIGIQTYWP